MSLAFSYSLLLVWLCLGFGCLAAAQSRAHKNVFGRMLSAQHQAGLVICGWLALGLSFVLALNLWSWGLALTLWFGIATLTGLLVIGLLSIWPSRLITLLLSSVVLAMSLTLIGFEL
jgi:hypothetical protein